MDADFISSVREEELVLLLGSNMGDKHQNLKDSIHLLTLELGPLSKISSVYLTEPWGNIDQESFVNQAVIIPCRIKPMIVLEIILVIEQTLGRVRFEKWGPRLIDIDIIFYGQLMYQSDVLEIPHPYMQQRQFVLDPIAEITPHFRHPFLDKTVAQIQKELLNES